MKITTPNWHLAKSGFNFKCSLAFRIKFSTGGNCRASKSNSSPSANKIDWSSLKPGLEWRLEGVG